MNEHIDSWKNKNVFTKQFHHGLTQLAQNDGNLPLHWKIFNYILSVEKPQNLLDIGCGSGLYFALIGRKFPEIEYVGFDYSEAAINMAKWYWNKDCFFVRDFWNLDKFTIDEFDVIHLGAILDIFPNGNEALDYILGLNPKKVIISRLEYSNSDEDEVSTYVAYDEITTYKFKHSRTKFLEIINKHGYTIEEYLLAEGNYIIFLKKL